MEDARFDVWTRRHFGLAAGSLAATVFGLAGSEAAQAKKKRKKRCKKLGAVCKPDGKRKCCGHLRCDVPGGDGSQQEVCCKTEGKPCDPDNPEDGKECCGELFCCLSGVCASLCVA